MQIIHSLTSVQLSEDNVVEIPTFHLQLPIQRNADRSGWNDDYGNPISPVNYIQEQLDLYGFSDLNSSLDGNVNYHKLAGQDGAWNICGIQNEQILFASIISDRENDILTSKQINWLTTALEAGLSTENFALIELD